VNTFPSRTTPTAAAPTRIEIYEDTARGWRWRMIAAENGQIVADSAEGYASVRNVQEATERLVDRMRAAVDVIIPQPFEKKGKRVGFLPHGTIRHEPYLLERVVEQRVNDALQSARYQRRKSRGTGRSTSRKGAQRV